MTSGPDPGELPGFWGSMVFRHAPIPRKGSGKQQQQQQAINMSPENTLNWLGQNKLIMKNELNLLNNFWYLRAKIGIIYFFYQFLKSLL